jgi:hypothetical protein
MPFEYTLVRYADGVEIGSALAQDDAEALSQIKNDGTFSICSDAEADHFLTKIEVVKIGRHFHPVSGAIAERIPVCSERTVSKRM